MAAARSTTDGRRPLRLRRGPARWSWSALEADITDQLAGRLQPTSELVEVDTLLSNELDGRQDLDGLDARSQGVLEGLLGEVPLRLLPQQEADELDRLVVVVGGTE